MKFNIAAYFLLSSILIFSCQSRDEKDYVELLSKDRDFIFYVKAQGDLEKIISEGEIDLEQIAALKDNTKLMEEEEAKEALDKLKASGSEDTRKLVELMEASQSALLKVIETYPGLKKLSEKETVQVVFDARKRVVEALN